MSIPETPPTWVRYDPPMDPPDHRVYTRVASGGENEYVRWERRRVHTCETLWYPIDRDTNEVARGGYGSGVSFSDRMGRSWQRLRQVHDLYVTVPDPPESVQSVSPKLNPMGQPGEWLKLPWGSLIRRGDQLWSQEPGQERVMTWSALSDERGAFNAELSARQRVVTVAMTTGGDTPASSTVISLNTGAIEVFRPDVTDWLVIEEST
jgi:hypothetical protein